jgi:hypothetical protein
MFPRNYFAGAFFAPRYFPGAAVAPVVGTSLDTVSVILFMVVGTAINFFLGRQPAPVLYVSRSRTRETYIDPSAESTLHIDRSREVDLER